MFHRFNVPQVYVRRRTCDIDHSTYHSLMQSSFIRFFGRGADDTGLYAFGLTPYVNTVSAETVHSKHTKHDNGWIDIDDGNTQRDQHNHDKGHTLFHVDIFETVERNIGHHGQARIQSHCKHRPCHSRALHAKVRHQPDKTSHQCSSSGRRQTLKITFINDRRVHIKPRQSQGCTGAIHKGCDPAPATQTLERPNIGDKCGRGTKRPV